MILAVEFADFGFGTVVGAVVAGSIAIFLDQRRRKDEKKRLFLEEKRLMYRSVLSGIDMLADDLEIFAKAGPYFDRLEELSPEVFELTGQFAVHFSRMIEKTRQQYMDNRVDFPLLGSRASGIAAMKVMSVIDRMYECLTSGEYGKVVELRKEYNSAYRDFRNVVRQDLGIDA
jgi:hypothetical protein